MRPSRTVGYRMAEDNTWNGDEKMNYNRYTGVS